LLKDTETDANLDYTELVNITEGFSGSDLRELCRNAAMLCVREAIKQQMKGDSFDVRTMTEEVSMTHIEFYDDRE
jgi:SpoVK/Ycf46/Vps4 family AAA+-type ATPase